MERRLEDGRDTRVNSGFVLAYRDDVKVTPVASTEIQLTVQGQLRSMTLCFDAHTLWSRIVHVGTLL